MFAVAYRSWWCHVTEWAGLILVSLQDWSDKSRGRFPVYQSLCISFKARSPCCAYLCEWMWVGASPRFLHPLLLPLSSVCWEDREMGRCHSNSVTVYWSCSSGEGPGGAMLWFHTLPVGREVCDRAPLVLWFSAWIGPVPCNPCPGRLYFSHHTTFSGSVAFFFLCFRCPSRRVPDFRIMSGLNRTHCLNTWPTFSLCCFNILIKEKVNFWSKSDEGELSIPKWFLNLSKVFDCNFRGFN